MENPFKKIPQNNKLAADDDNTTNDNNDENTDTPRMYTGDTKLTVDATGAIVSEELAEEDKRFDEERQ